MLKEILKAEYVEILQGCLGREWNRRDAPRNSIREVGTGAVGLGFVPPNLPRIASVSQRKKKRFPAVLFKPGWELQLWCDRSNNPRA